MLARTDITGTKPVVHVEAPTPVTPLGDARAESYNRLAQIAIGRQLQAEILSRFSDGTFLVRIADTAARMTLPGSAQVGDMLDLTLVTKEPRPTFLLAQQAGSATTSLSTTGRMIDNLLHAAQEGGAPATLVGKAPLIASSGAGPAQLATALQDALVVSGLFYESHVSQWAGGSRAATDLLREPQAGNALPNQTAAGMQSAQSAARAQASLGLAHDMPVQAADAAAANAIALTQPAALAADAARLINLQLETLEQRRVQWQGELWPGQPLEWDVAEEPRKNNADTGDKSWVSVVRFDLPALGAISATIRLTNGHVQVQVKAASDAAAASLRAHGGALAGALDAAGSPLDLLTVKHDESS